MTKALRGLGLALAASHSLTLSSHEPDSSSSLRCATFHDSDATSRACSWNDAAGLARGGALTAQSLTLPSPPAVATTPSAASDQATS